MTTAPRPRSYRRLTQTRRRQPCSSPRRCSSPARPLAALLMSSSARSPPSGYPSVPRRRRAPRSSRSCASWSRDGAPGALAVVRTPSGIRRAQAGLARRGPGSTWRRPIASGSPASRRPSSPRSCCSSSRRESCGLDDPDRALAARTRPGRPRDHDPRVARPHKRSLRLLRRRGLRPGGDRTSRPHLVAAQTRRDRCLAPAALLRPERAGPTPTPTTSCSASSSRP